MKSELFTPVTIHILGICGTKPCVDGGWFSRRRLAAQAHVLPLARSCGIYGLQSGTVIRFFPAVIGA